MEHYYLINAAKGKFELTYENRLSRIFSASFNSSTLFRKMFFEFIGFGKSYIKYFAKTEVCNIIYDGSLIKRFKNKKGLNDITIYYSNEKEPVIIIENKIEADFELKQIEKYNAIIKQNRWKPRKKLLMLKYFKEKEGWESYHWNNFHLYLKDNIKQLNRDYKHEVDKFIINNFLKYLEELGMAYVTKIKKSEFKNVANCIYLITNYSKLEEKPAWISNIYSNGAFATLNNFISMLQDIFSDVRNEPFLRNKIEKKKIQFTPRMGYYPAEDKAGKTINRSLYIGFEIKVKNVKKPIKYLGTSIDFYSNNNNFRGIFAYASDEDNYIDKFAKEYKFIKDGKGGEEILHYHNYYKFVKNAWEKFIEK